MQEVNMNPFQHLPSVDALLAHPEAQTLLEKWKRPWVVYHLRAVLEEEREKIRCNKDGFDPNPQQILKELHRKLENFPSLVPLINATGVPIHTNVGRAPFGEELMEHLRRTLTGYCNLELDLSTGKRGKRGDHLEGYLKFLFGAQSIHLVNNNAGAVLLVLAHHAREREVVLSRGELVEIGASFRIPDIITFFGAKLKEVGTTNRTHLRDYENAIGENTALLMKVHPSNFFMEGFTKEVELADLCALSKSYGIALYEDAGSMGLAEYSFEEGRKVLQEHLSHVDILTFSGDKLLGGPQCGIILGKREFVEPLKKNPLSRVLRADKMTIAALEATLMTYLRKDAPSALEKMISTTQEQLLERTERFQRKLGQGEILTGDSPLGGGAHPRVRLPSVKLALKPDHLSSALGRLRKHEPPVIVQAEDDRLFIDLRTVFEKEEEMLLHALEEAML